MVISAMTTRCRDSEGSTRWATAGASEIETAMTDAPISSDRLSQFPASISSGTFFRRIIELGVFDSLPPIEEADVVDLAIIAEKIKSVKDTSADGGDVN